LPIAHNGTLRRPARSGKRGTVSPAGHGGGRQGTIKTYMADDKLYKAVSMGSGTFLITKPKRKAAKRRQSALKHPRRGARK